MRWPALPQDDLAVRLDRRGIASPGSVLIQSPYDPDEYAGEADASDSFALQKVAIFTRLCQLLGAKEVEVEVLEDESTHKQYRAQARGGKGPVTATGHVQHDAHNSVASNISWVDTYSGGSADLKGALALLAAHNLYGDPTLASLVQAGDSAANRQQTRRLTVDLTRESKKALEIAAGLKIPAAFSASATFKRNLTAQSHYRITYRVQF